MLLVVWALSSKRSEGFYSNLAHTLKGVIPLGFCLIFGLPTFETVSRDLDDWRYMASDTDSSRYSSYDLDLDHMTQNHASNWSKTLIVIVSTPENP